MASNQTPNYALNQWAPSDQVVRLDFNADNEKIDAALAGLAQEVSAKAEQSEVDTLSATVKTKADQTALNSLITTVNSKADQSALSSLTTTVNSKANQSTVTSLTNTVNTKASKTELNTLRQDMTAGDLWVKLGEATLSADSHTFSVNLSHINFFNYWKVKVLYAGGASGEVHVRINNISSNSGYDVVSASNNANSNSAYLCNFPTYNSQHTVAGEIVSHIPTTGMDVVFYCRNASTYGRSIQNTVSRVKNVKWDALTSISFTAGASDSATIPAGAKALIIGMPL